MGRLALQSHKTRLIEHDRALLMLGLVHAMSDTLMIRVRCGRALLHRTPLLESNQENVRHDQDRSAAQSRGMEDAQR